MEGCRAGFVLCCPGGLWWWWRAESVARWLGGHASPPEHRARADSRAACASASPACAGACPCSAQPLAGPSATAWPFASASQPLTGSSTCANSGAQSLARSCACA